MYRSFLIKLFLLLAVVWVLCFAILSQQHAMLLLGLLAFSFGLRHGFDADHIIAIDNVTRQLRADNKASVSTGLFFALGHSSIVFILTLLILLGTKIVHGQFHALQDIGGIVGSIISAFFLWLSAAMNIHALLSRQKKIGHHHPAARSILTFLAKRIFQKINCPQKMYFVGFLFGLGFDTATEVGLLSIAATSSLQGFQAGSILLLPILFASGMILTDSLDSLFMSSFYQLRGYNVKVIVFTAVLALFIGAIEIIGIMPLNRWYSFIINMTGWINNNFEIVGGTIVLLFFILWCYTQLKYRFSKNILQE